MSKNKLIVLIVVLVAIASIAWVLVGHQQYSNVLAGCPGYTPQNGFGPGTTDYSFIDCKGIIVLEEVNYRNPKYIQIRDISHNYTPAIINSTADYKIIGDNLYAIQGGFGANSDERGLFLLAFSKGAVQEIRLKSEADIPKFIKINTQTGDVVFYKGLADVPSTEQSIVVSIQ